MNKALVPFTAIALQVIFVLLTILFESIDPIIFVVITLLIGVVSLQLGVYSAAKKMYPKTSLVIVVISWMMILFTIFANLLPEAGIPPYICEPVCHIVSVSS